MLSREILVGIGGYALLWAVAIWWLFAREPPFERPSAPLFIFMATGATLVSSIGLLTAFSLIHWANTASMVIVGASALIGVLSLFAPWDWYFLWQLTVLLGAELFVLVGALAGFRLLRVGLVRLGPHVATGPRVDRISLLNLLTLMTAFAIASSVVVRLRPLDLRPGLAVLLIVGGAASAGVALSCLVACVSNLRWPVRLILAFIVAPIGGVVYAIGDRLVAGLMFDWVWYCGVTCVQMTQLAVPLLVMRARGYRMARPSAAGPPAG